MPSEHVVFTLQPKTLNEKLLINPQLGGDKTTIAQNSISQPTAAVIEILLTDEISVPSHPEHPSQKSIHRTPTAPGQSERPDCIGTQLPAKYASTAKLFSTHPTRESNP